MRPVDILALVSPICPVILVTLILAGHWWRGLIAPAQFSAFVAEASLAIAARMTATHLAAAIGFVIAVAGLVAIAYRDQWDAHRAASAFRWEQFEADFHAYLTTHPPDTGGGSPADDTTPATKPRN